MTSPSLRIESPSLGIVNRRRRAWARRIAVVGVWGVCMALLAAYAPDLTGIYGTALTFVCLALLVGSLRGGPTASAARRGEPGTVTVDGGALRVQIGGRTQTIARGDVVAGWTEEGRGRTRVTLQIRTGEVVAADVMSTAVSHALLEALGVAPEQRAVAVQLGSPHTPARRFVLALVGLLSLAVAAPSALFSAALAVETLRGRDHWLGVLVVMGHLWVFTSVGVWLGLRPLVGTTLRIGTDGLSIRRLLRRRFVPRAEIAGVRVHGAALIVERRSGRPVVVMTSGAEEAAALARRVTDALVRQAAGAPVEALATLDRAGRPLAEWTHAIIALLRESAGYRRAGIVADDLFSVVEDGAAKPERRVAAAAALASCGEPAAKVRVRAAAEACVNNKLRIAILRAADGEIDEGALAAAEEEAMRRA